MDSPARQPIVPASWSGFYDETQIPAAVRLGSTLRVTGHTGDRDGVFSEEPEEQIRQTFRNLGETLAAAGANWSAVVELTSYHIGLQRQAAALLRVAADFLESPYPAWSAVGVTELFEPGAVVEISCVAELAD